MIINFVTWQDIQQGDSVRPSLIICLLWHPPWKQMFDKDTTIVIRMAKQTTSHCGEDCSTQRLIKFTDSQTFKVMQYSVKFRWSRSLISSQRMSVQNHLQLSEKWTFKTSTLWYITGDGLVLLCVRVSTGISISNFVYSNGTVTTQKRPYLYLTT